MQAKFLVVFHCNIQLIFKQIVIFLKWLGFQPQLSTKFQLNSQSIVNWSYFQHMATCNSQVKHQHW